MRASLLGLAYIVLTVLLGSVVLADTIKFRWDANLASDLGGYRLYQRPKSGNYIFGISGSIATIPAETEFVSVKYIPKGKWCWVVRAFDKCGNEAWSSNEVCVTVGVMPSAPIMLLLDLL